MAHVFLSYKREDVARARKLVAALRARGVDVWWDEDIPASAPWETTIEKALAASATVIVCWSPASVASENVRSEARVARQERRLIQVFLKPCSPPLFFGERQGIDLTKWRGNHNDPRVSALIQAVREAGARELGAVIERPKRQRGYVRAFPRVLRHNCRGTAALLGGGLIAYHTWIARPAPELASASVRGSFAEPRQGPRRSS